MPTAALVKNSAQKKTANVEDDRVSCNDSEMHAEQNGDVERHEVSQIEVHRACLASVSTPPVPSLTRGTDENRHWRSKR